MSTTKPSDCGAWMRKNYPNLTDHELSIFCELLSGEQLSRASLAVLRVMPARSLAATLKMLNSIRASWQAERRSTAIGTLEDVTDQASPPERGKD